MKIYRIFLKKADSGKIQDLELIAEGYSYLSLFFGFFYLFYKKLWLQGLLVFLLCLLSMTAQYILSGFYIGVIAVLGSLVFSGFEYIDWKSKKMIKDGYQYLGYSSGNNEREAKLKFLENINSNQEQSNKMEQKVF